MILRLKVKSWKLVCSIRKVSYVVGVTSKLKENNEHILMWDFDNTDLYTVIGALKTNQSRYLLPEIKILASNQEQGNYHAYCFSRQTWQQAVVIVAGTPGIDWDFVRLALYRNNFTIRISDKLGKNKPKLVYTMEGFSLSDCMPEDLEDYIQYEIWTDKEGKK
jgi:hypothetical protein